MSERAGLVTMKGNPVTLVGNEVRVGDAAPEFTVLDNGLQPVDFFSFRGKVCVVASVPSLDTPVCDAEIRRFNMEAGGLGSGVQILTISTDLPFAQKRWCGAAGVNDIQTLSDHREVAFGNAWGVLVKEFRLLARAVFVVDREGKVAYSEIVSEIAHEPDYDAALAAIRKLV